MIYSSLDIECKRLKLVTMGHFLPFYLLPKNLKNQNFEKMKKVAGDIIILYTKLYQHPQSNAVRFLRYEVRHNFLWFWDIFCPLTLLTTQKIRILKKKCGDIIFQHLCTTNGDHMMHGSWAMKHNIIFCHFGSFLIFALLLH